MKPKKEGKKFGRETRERRSQKKPRKREKKALERRKREREEKEGEGNAQFVNSLKSFEKEGETLGERRE